MNEQTLFIAALERESAEDRTRFLDQACTDPDLRSRVEHLLEVFNRSNDFLDQPAAPVREARDSARDFEGVGQTIGPYKLLEQIGEGGMGVVYMAAQQSPVKRKVALKIIKPGMDTKQVIARFEAERQALALMDHPNIAHVLDAGATSSGRPFFVMELVRGLPVTEYCQREKLNVQQRLQLFIDVCHAVQHAHLKGIIHRDIKPSNVMVTLHDGNPVVKMIDFGVAKATNQQLTDRTLFTNYAQIIGTPLYMSPEQAEMSGLDVDTRSDIYSLGVLLYELLTDTTPFEESRLKEVGYDEMRRIIREEEPPKPSARLSTINSADKTITDRRKSETRQVVHTLRGELDWIVVRALEKKRGRRYQSAKDFADDVKRYLDDEPVEACPPSVSYRVRKFLGRHRGAAATAGAVTLLLVLATTVSTLFAIRARTAEKNAAEARKAAETEAAIAKAITNFLSEEVLGQANPYENPNRDLTLREVLDRASERIEDGFDGPPLVEAAIRTTLGTTYIELGEYEAAKKHLRRAQQLRQAELSEHHRDLLQNAYQIATVNMFDGSRDAAAKSLEATLAAQQLHLGPADPDSLLTMDWLAFCYTMQRRYDEAESLFNKALDGFLRVRGPDHPDTLDCQDGMAKLYQHQKRYDEAEKLNAQILETRRRVLRKDHPQVIDSVASLAAVKLALGKKEVALQLYRDAVAARKRVQGPTHPATLGEARDLAIALQKAGQFDDAETLLDESMDLQLEHHGSDDVRTLWMQWALARLYLETKRYDEAEETLRAALASPGSGKDESLRVSLLTKLASVHNQLEQHGEACKIREQVIEIRKRQRPRNDALVLEARLALAYNLQQAKRYSEAEKELLSLIGPKTADQDRDPFILLCRIRLGFVYRLSGRLAEAETAFGEVWRVLPPDPGRGDSETLRAGSQFASILRNQGKLEEAEKIHRKVHQARLNIFGEDNADTIRSLGELAKVCESLRKYDEAAQHLDDLVRLRRQQTGDHLRKAILAVQDLAKLADTHRRQGDPDRAKKLDKRVNELVADMERQGAETNSIERFFALTKIKMQFGKIEDALSHYDKLAASPEFQNDKRTCALALELSVKLQSLNRLTEAERLVNNLLTRQLQLPEPDQQSVLDQQLRLGFIIRQQERFAEAEALFKEIWEKAPIIVGPNDARTLSAGHQVAYLRARTRRPDEAEPVCLQVLETRQRVYGAVSLETAETLMLLANIYRQQDRLDKTADVFHRVFQSYRQLFGDQDSRTLKMIQEVANLATAHAMRREWDSAASLRARVYSMRCDAWGEKHPKSIDTISRLSRDYERAGDWPKVYETRLRELTLRRDPEVQKHAPCYCMQLTSEALIKLERFDEAEELLSECVASWEKAAPDNPLKFIAHRLLGEVLITQGNYQEAERVLLHCHQEWLSRGNKKSFSYRRVLESLLGLYEASHQSELAAQWADELTAIQ